MSKTFRIGGVHPHDNKLSRDCAIENFPLTGKAYISMAQHLGAPAKPLVAKGDKVLVGQCIGEAAGFISAPVHASHSGTVLSVGPRPDFFGRPCLTVEIAVEGDEWLPEIDRSPKVVREITLEPAQMLAKIKAAGVVGLGGAAFPCSVKLAPPPGKKAECLILNGTECEPFLTSDYRIMLERTEEILIGAEIMRRILGVKHVVVGIEENKPLAIQKMRESLASVAAQDPSVRWEVLSLKKRYPQGGEKQLIDAVLRRQVPSMALPIDVGAVVQNVGTSLAVYEAVQKNKPLIDNVITVTGTDTALQRNFLVRVGTPVQEILDYAGGLSAQTAKVIMGGPMMGKAATHLEAPTVKASGCVLSLTARETLRKPQAACIRCGKCTQACPMGLEPYHLFRLAMAGRMDEMEDYHIQDCIECGCCLYTCPAYIPLLDVIRLNKAKVLGIIRSRGKK